MKIIYHISVFPYPFHSLMTLCHSAQHISFTAMDSARFRQAMTSHCGPRLFGSGVLDLWTAQGTKTSSKVRHNLHMCQQLIANPCTVDDTEMISEHVGFENLGLFLMSPPLLEHMLRCFPLTKANRFSGGKPLRKHVLCLFCFKEAESSATKTDCNQATENGWVCLG